MVWSYASENSCALFLYRAKVIVRLARKTRHHLYNTQVYTSPCILSKHSLNAHTHSFLSLLFCFRLHSLFSWLCVCACFFSPYRLAKWMLSYSYQEYNDVIYDCVWISWVAVHSWDMRLSITSPVLLFFLSIPAFFGVSFHFSISWLRILYRQSHKF